MIHQKRLLYPTLLAALLCGLPMAGLHAQGSAGNPPRPPHGPPPNVLFDALVLPDGDAGVAALARDGQTMGFLRDQYRHCKTIMAIGASKALLDRLGVGATLPDGQADTGLLIVDGGNIDAAITDFIAAVGMHRHTVRDSDPPLI